ncbi:bifunctional riboflavin kinase/FAD synthetase [Ammoniphilus resinae]|uniref:Riboflavin biosynthesis protein n=1 Tax=Ammoniphilus resinae TaxID=861532 RepID=A0ABS4GNA0_9BACL|nr:bifunctional riboflavin kinase/FAD synthetase [Ammoniphilus resinae]MBP1931537.1 riboflavin kinase/FMN adenylyltransferase [Ammoniphilus resinae]
MNINYLRYPLELDNDIQSYVMAIGYFDGVHVGHRRVIQRAIDLSNKKNLQAAVMTFHPHPREVLGRSGYTHYLTPLQDKLEVFRKMGVDTVFVVQFDIPFSSIYPEDFIDEFLIPLQAKHIIVGFDYTFGYRGQGTAYTLKEQSKDRYQVDVVSPITRYGEKISSTIIREYLYGGKIEQANEFLGRPYAIKGMVVHGEKRGRLLGFPTANLNLDEPYLVPRTGVYGVRVDFEGTIHFGVMNVGIKPTFDQVKKEKSLEVYIFDFNENLYDKELTVEFLFFIREEQKFAGVEQLVQQIKQDVETARSRIESIRS